MIIYKTTNLINNKIYIGQTDGKNKSYKGGGKLLKKAFIKYGKENFKFETIVEGNFNNILTDSLEIHYIKLYNSTNRNIGYNIEVGGKGHKNETKIKIGQSIKGIKRSEETKKRMSISRKGIHLSNEIKYKIFKNSVLKKQVGQFDLKNNLIKTFESSREAGRKLNINYAMIGKACRNGNIIYKKYIFKYLSENNNTKYRKIAETTKLKISDKNGLSIQSLDIITGKIIKEYKSIKEASIDLKTVSTNINNVLKGRSKSAKGFKWVYKKND